LVRQEHEKKLRQLEIRRSTIESQMAVLRAEAEAAAAELEFTITQEDVRKTTAISDSKALAKLRGNSDKPETPTKKK
jgi:hypothetical protein